MDTMCPLCGSDKTTVCVQGVVDGMWEYHIRCRVCMMTTAVTADPSEMIFGKYEKKDLAEMLVAVGLLTTYPETTAYVSQLQKDLEAAISRLDVSAKETA